MTNQKNLHLLNKDLNHDPASFLGGLFGVHVHMHFVSSPLFPTHLRNQQGDGQSRGHLAYMHQGYRGEYLSDYVNYAARLTLSQRLLEREKEWPKFIKS